MFCSLHVTLIILQQFAVDHRSAGQDSRAIAEWLPGAVADYFKENG